MKPDISVVICTIGNAVTLRQSVQSALDQTDVHHEVVVVDNAPRSQKVTAALAGLDDDRLRLICEPEPGLSRARNRGLAVAHGPYVAFTDDDAIADPGWLGHVANRFAADSRTVAVTGRVLTAAPDQDSSRWFDEGFGFDRGVKRQVWCLDSVAEQQSRDRHLADPGHRGVGFPFATGDLGSGNNMAFRTDWLRSRGGFDIRLGAGSPTRGGEDLDALRAVLMDGHVVAYCAEAVVTHHHRSSLPELRRQAFGYGTGMVASVMVLAAQRPAVIPAIAARGPRALRVLLGPTSIKNARKSPDFPKSVSGSELFGYLVGPLLTAWSAWQAVRSHRSRP